MGNLILIIEGDRWMVTLGRYRQQDLPDEDSFLDYARSLPQPDVYEAIKDAEPLTPVLTYKYSANRWRRYERMPRFPEGFVILGDAMCSFNPIYGQGMTVAALEAKMLDACLRRYFRGTSRRGSGFAQRFQKEVAKMVEWPWKMATGADLFYVKAEAKQTWSRRLLDRYMLRLGQLTMSDPLVAERFNEVMHMLKMPVALFEPRIAWAVLKQELASRKPQVAVSLPSGDSGPLTGAEPRHALP